MVKPGVTCIWQVSGRSDVDFDTWIDMDLEYIEDWSLGLDLKLLVEDRSGRHHRPRRVLTAGRASPAVLSQELSSLARPPRIDAVG